MCGKEIWQQRIARVMGIIAMTAAILLCAQNEAICTIEEKIIIHEESQEEKIVEKTEELVENITEEPVKCEYSLDWDAEESYLLAKIAMAEAEGESIEGKAMVMKVVLNRVNTKGFPDSIEEVICEYSESANLYQFSPVEPGGRWWKVQPNEDCWEALELIYSGWDESGGALYFEATYNGEETWHSKNLEYIKTVGNHNFYK